MLHQPIWFIIHGKKCTSNIYFLTIRIIFFRVAFQTEYIVPFMRFLLWQYQYVRLYHVAGQRKNIHMKHWWWNCADRWRRQYSEKGLPSATLSTTSHTDCPGTEPKPPWWAASEKLPICIAQFSISIWQYRTLNQMPILLLTGKW